MAATATIRPRHGRRRLAEAHQDGACQFEADLRAPRVHADGGRGQRHSRKRIARSMREAGLVGASHRHGGPTTTRRNKDDRPAPDLVDRDFSATRPNKRRVADITYVPTMAGFLDPAVVLDAWSRKIVGWAMANHLGAELALDAMESGGWPTAAHGRHRSQRPGQPVYVGGIWQAVWRGRCSTIDGVGR